MAYHSENIEVRGYTTLGSLGAAFLLALLALSPLFPAQLSAQTGTITGLVVDQATGEPLPGAQVAVEGTRLGAASRQDGRYTIANVPVGTYAVVVHFIGRGEVRSTDVRVVAGQATTLNFELRHVPLRLEQMVVTGVVDPIEGVKMPFSVGRLSKEDLPVPTTHSAIAAIQGKVAGASIIRSSGQPGTGVSVLLRTPTSIQRSNSPMFVVDGVVLGSTFDGTTVDLESLDIESIEVVKGAAAAALYGSRAASGVVQITTSRGAGLGVNQTRLTYRSEIGSSALPNGIRFSNSHHFATNEQGQFVNAAGQPTNRRQDRVVASDRIMDKPWPGETFDNVNQFYRPGLFNTNSFTISHNTGATNFLVSANNYQEKGSIVSNEGFERNNLRVNLDHRFMDNLRLSVSAFHNRSVRDDLSGSPFWDLLLFPPDVNLGIRDANGNFLQQPDSTQALENPIWRQTSRDNKTRRMRTLLSGQLDFRPASWIRFDGNLSYDRSDIRDQVFVPKGTPFAFDPGTEQNFSDGQLDLGSTGTDTFNGALSAHLMRRFGDLNTRVTVRGLFERESRLFFFARGQDFLVQDVPRINVAERQTGSSNQLEIRADGFFVQTGLDYQGKYIGDFLVRRDGSSLFGPDNRWNTYYRASGAYRMSEEAWWPVDAFTEFKLRFSQGTAGGRPNFSDQFEVWSVSSSGAVSKSTLGNRFLGPETTTEREYGLDFIVRDRFVVEATYVQQETRDQLVQMPQPAASGFSNQWQNSGTIRGNTIELSMQALLVQTPRFSWDMTLVADRSRSRISEWNRVCFLTTLGNRCEGASLSEIHGDRFLRGANDLPEWHRGSMSYFDVNDDGYLVAVGPGGSWRDQAWGTTVSVDGRTYQWGMPIKDQDEDGNTIVQKIGEGFPDAGLGMINQFRFGGISVHTHLHSQIGGDVYNNTRQRLYQHNRHGDLDQSGKAPETRKTIDYYQALYNTNNVSSHFIEDGTFLKLRELSVSYLLPREIIHRIGLGRAGVERMTLGLVGRNLFTITNYTGFDPEVGTVLTRLDSFDWPNTRTFTATITVDF